MFFRRKRSGENKKSRVLRTYGLTETVIRKKLRGIFGAGADMELLSHPKGIDLTITVEGESEKLLDELVETTEKQIRHRLGEHVFGTGNEKMEGVAGRILSDREISLSVAESCTGGLICHWLTNVPGSSEYFKQGIIAYSNSAKTSLLNLPGEILKKFGAVSPETAEEMAKRVKETGGTDIGIAVTGIAGPGGGTREKPVGLVYTGFSSSAKIVSEEHHFGGGRELIKIQAAQASLDLLRRNIIKQ